MYAIRSYYAITAGDTWTTTINRTVLPTDIGYMAGVTFADATVSYSTAGTIQMGPFTFPTTVNGSMTVPWPGAIFTPPTPLTAVTTMDRNNFV